MSDSNAQTEVEKEVSENQPINGSFLVRCLESTMGKSKSGKPMMTQSFEIFGSSNQKVNGIKVKTWVVCDHDSLGRVNTQRRCLDLPELKSKEELDNLDPAKYKGTEGPVLIKSSSTELKNPEGGIELNAMTQQPIMVSRREISMWLSRT